MTFSFWSLDFIYYPVSGIMWVWHKIFGSFMGYANPWVWVLSVIFLVFTLRAVLFKPFMKQMDSSLKMQEIQPEMKRIREKYKDDRQRQSEELMKLNKEAGVNPLASCLPALLQAPAFIGLFHVLRNFNTAFEGGAKVVEAGNTGPPVNNYFFPVSDVQSFHDALLFGGASLAGHLLDFVGGGFALATGTDIDDLPQLGANFQTQLAVAIPLMIVAAIATHLSSRKSVARQSRMGGAQSTGQMAIMQKLMLYVFPLAVLGIGWFYPLALLFYWLANNSWTFAQLFVAHRVQDRKLAEEAMVVEAEKESTSFSKPKPGAKPKSGTGPKPGAKPTAGAGPKPGAKPGAGGAPKPGAKPKRPASGGGERPTVKPTPRKGNSAAAAKGSVSKQAGNSASRGKSGNNTAGSSGAAARDSNSKSQSGPSKSSPKRRPAGPSKPHANPQPGREQGKNGSSGTDSPKKRKQP